jgi:hypothetical protein
MKGLCLLKTARMGMEVVWEDFEEDGHWLNEPKGMDGIVRFIKEVMASTWAVETREEVHEKH